MSKVAWPSKFDEFYYQVRLHAEKIRSGTLLAIDPASGSDSLPGFALFHAGELQTSGTIALNKKASIQQRLAVVYEKVAAISPAAPDVLVIELLRGKMVHWNLQRSAGVAIAASRAPVLIECPILVWKALAKTDHKYVKGDQADAEKLGQSVIALARESK